MLLPTNELFIINNESDKDITPKAKSLMLNRFSFPIFVLTDLNTCDINTCDKNLKQYHFI